ncbi:integral membrane protein-like protein [Amylocarpus encephaloides]|uniref:Integral membrane protein-like protein n=1 Tax=Amylocarpus encephaloides TaxID=45428 RepID=A0A9P7YCT8_9HELO|nr:integral membrane protein-like protein [Amylocarpus encephaloides]
MKIFASILPVVAATSAPVATSLATFAAGSNNAISYNVGVPPGSTISQSVKGGLYFSMSAPESYNWVGLGTGSAMRNSMIFLMYADGTGNVTISGRAGGRGHVQPILDEELMKGVTLLAGSGIVGGRMVANVHCTTCQLASDATSTTSPWIAAWNEGPAINSKSPSYSIDRHGDSAISIFNFDLSKAALTSDANPFLTSSSSGGAAIDPSPNSGSSSSGSSSGSSSVISVADPHKLKRPHGIVMGIAVTILFPTGAMFVRLRGHPWIHAGIQLASLICMIAGLGLGVKLAQSTDLLFTNTHSVLGVAVVALFLVQPLLGLVHHHMYKRTGGRTIFSHLHIWYGRSLMLLAVINGGLGLDLATDNRPITIAYSVVAGVFGLAYIAVTILKRKGNSLRHEEKREPALRQGSY